MKFNAQQQKWLKNGAALVVLVLIVVAVSFFAGGAGKYFAEEGLQMTEAGIRRAAVQCYALEGHYPANLAYLQEYYGIRLDEKYYVVYYDFVASNLMPDITVLLAEPSETPAN